MKNKITTEHLSRQAFVYVRQSTASQVIEHRESQRLQYRLVDRAKEMGWSAENIYVIDSDLGTSATGCVNRVGFQNLLAAVCEGVCSRRRGDAWWVAKVRSLWWKIICQIPGT